MAVPPILANIGRYIGTAAVSEGGKEIASGIMEHPALKGWVAQLIEAAAPGTLATWSSWQVRSRANLLLQLAKIRVEVEQTAGPQIRELLAVALKDYFGVDVNPRVFLGGFTRPEPAQEAQGIGAGVLHAMFGELGAGHAPTPADGTRAAERLLGWAIADTLGAWVADVLGLGYIESEVPGAAGLGDRVINALGVGRVTRRALTPALNALVVRPATYDYNRRFRTRAMSPAQATRAYVRGQIEWRDFDNAMGYAGITAEDALRIAQSSFARLSRADLRRMLEQRLITREGALAELKRQGHSEERARGVLELLENDRLDSLHTAAVTVARDMYRDREATLSELLEVARATGYTTDELAALQAVAELERSRPKRVSQATMEKAYREGVVELGRLTAYYTEEGYSSDDADILEQLAVKARLEEEARDKAAAARRKPPEPGAVALTVAVEAFRRGWIEEPALREMLGKHNLAPAELELRVRTAIQRRKEYQEQLARRALAGKAITATSATVEDAYVRGLVGELELRAYYTTAGFADPELSLLLRIRQAERAEILQRQAAAAARNTKQRA